jgi:hypothetical protein
MFLPAPLLLATLAPATVCIAFAAILASVAAAFAVTPLSVFVAAFAFGAIARAPSSVRVEPAVVVVAMPAAIATALAALPAALLPLAEPRLDALDDPPEGAGDGTHDPADQAVDS